MIAWSLLDWAVVLGYGLVASLAVLMATVLVWSALTRRRQDDDEEQAQ